MNSSHLNPDMSIQLLELMKFLNYSIDEKGMCYGVIHTAKQAIIANGLDAFTNRLSIISQITTKLKQSGALNSKDLTVDKKHEVLKQQINDFCQIEKIPLEQVSAIYVNFIAFFDSISLFQAIYQYQHLFESHKKPYVQDAAPALSLVISKELEEKAKQKGLTDVTQIVQCLTTNQSYSNVLDKNKLANSFQRLRQSVIASQSTQPIELEFESIKHAILVSYDPKKDTWTLIDPRHLPPIPFYDINRLADTLCLYYKEINVDSFYMNVFTEQGNNALIEEIDKWLSLEKKVVLNGPILKSDETSLTYSQWLYVAAHSNDIEVLNKLLQQQNPNINFTHEGCTPVCVAVERGYAEVVKTLITTRSVNIEQLYYGYSLLFIAAKNGHAEVVKVLLDQGASYHSFHGATPLFTAAENEHEKIVKLFIDRGFDYIEDVVSAIYLENDSALKTFLRAGVDVETVWDNKTLLYVAIEGKNVNAIKILLEKGADPIKVLTLARANNQEDIIRKRFEEMDHAIFSNNQQESYHKARWLYEAASQGYDWLVKALLNAGVNKAGSTLSIAIQNGHADVAKLLMDPDEALKLDDLLIASQRGHVSVLKMLIEDNSDLADSIMNAIVDNHLSYDALQTFKQAGIDLEGEFRDGSLLHHAIECGNKELANKLIKLGCNLTQLDTNKNTPLDIAYQNDDQEMINILLNGIVIDIDRHLKNTNSSNSFEQIAEIILDQLKNHTSIFHKLDALNIMLEEIFNNEKSKTHSFSMFKASDLSNRLESIKIAYIKTVQSFNSQHSKEVVGMIDRIMNLNENTQFLPIEPTYTSKSINQWIEANSTTKNTKSPK